MLLKETGVGAQAATTTTATAAAAARMTATIIKQAIKTRSGWKKNCFVYVSA